MGNTGLSRKVRGEVDETHGRDGYRAAACRGGGIYRVQHWIRPRLGGGGPSGSGHALWPVRIPLWLGMGFPLLRLPLPAAVLLLDFWLCEQAAVLAALAPRRL